MALGDGIRRNIAAVDPTERAMLRDALIELNNRKYPGSRTDTVPGGVTWWFKQDEIHQATHVHGRPEFAPWHREIVNRLEELLRQINPLLSLHYWNWTQDPRAIPNANLGGGVVGTLNLFTAGFMGYGGSSSAPIGEPWLSAGYYVPGATPHRDATGNPADPPRSVDRSVAGSPASVTQDQAIVAAGDYHTMWTLLSLRGPPATWLPRKGGSAMRVRMLAGAAVVGLLVALLTPLAAVAQAETTTTHFNVTGSSPSVNPCTGAPGTLTETITGVTQVTELPDGTRHEATTGVGTFTFVPDDPSQPTYTGKETFTVDQNFNSKTFTLTFTGYTNALGSDGSRFTAIFVGHVTINPDGTATVQFDTVRLRCP